jgi:hypothetical protein
MFNFFRRATAEDYKQIATDIYKIPNSIKEPTPKEYYRVGRTDDGCTTLTMLDSSGYSSMTLTMNQSACKQLIRMLESTFHEEQPIEETQE